jgi:hypothetical protein
MKQRTLIASVVAAAAALGFAAGAWSQDAGGLKNAATGGIDTSSLASASAGNAAGVIEYCLQNNFLAGAAASSMRDKLIGKIGGADNAQQDSGYAAGVKGTLMGSDGKSIELGSIGGSLESNITQKACSAVLEHASSLL